MYPTITYTSLSFFFFFHGNFKPGRLHFVFWSSRLFFIRLLLPVYLTLHNLVLFVLCLSRWKTVLVKGTTFPLVLKRGLCKLRIMPILRVNVGLWAGLKHQHSDKFVDVLKHWSITSPSGGGQHNPDCAAHSESDICSCLSHWNCWHRLSTSRIHWKLLRVHSGNVFFTSVCVCAKRACDVLFLANTLPQNVQCWEPVAVICSVAPKSRWGVKPTSFPSCTTRNLLRFVGWDCIASWELARFARHTSNVTSALLVSVSTMHCDVPLMVACVEVPWHLCYFLLLAESDLPSLKVPGFLLTKAFHCVKGPPVTSASYVPSSQGLSGQRLVAFVCRSM